MNEADKKFRKLVAEIYGLREDYLAAAPVLEGITFNEQSDKPEDVKERITTWQEIAQFYFDAEEPTDAEKWVVK